MEQGEIVGRLLGPADEDRAEAVEPRVGALHDPAPRLATGVTLGPGFLAPAAQVKREAEFRGQGAQLLVVEALIETEVLRMPAGRLWAPDRDGFERLTHYTASSLRTVVRRALGRLPTPELAWSRGHET